MLVSRHYVKDSVSAKTVFLSVFLRPTSHPRNLVMPSVAGFFCVCASFTVFLKPRSDVGISVGCWYADCWYFFRANFSRRIYGDQ